MNISAHRTGAAAGVSVLDKLDLVVRDWTDSGRIVGAVVLVRMNGEQLHFGASGFADREAKVLTRTDTVFRWASLTKAVTSLATLALVERGTLRLDDPVTRFLPQFQPQLPGGREPTITFRHLLTHTAGLTYAMLEPAGGPYHRAGVSDGLDQPGLSRRRESPSRCIRPVVV